MAANPKSAEFRIARQRTELILTQPFFGALALRLVVAERDDLPTMATDGVHLFYNRAFVDGMNDGDLRGVIAHEVLHCVYDHCGRILGREPERWNQAADYVINPVVKAAGFTLPDGCLDDPQYHGMHADKVDGMLPPTPPGGGGSGAGPGGVLAPPPGTAPADLATDWAVAAAQAVTADRMSRGAGKLPAEIDRMVQDLLHPQADWRELLRRFLDPLSRGEYSWSRPNRRFIGAGVILPGNEPDEVGPMVLIVDTSGSMDHDALRRCISELNAIAGEVEPEAIDCIGVDTAVHGHARFERGDPITQAGWVKGGGGTRFAPGFAWAAQHAPCAEAIIYLTDGDCADFGPAPACPVIWAAVDNPGFAPPFGDVLHLRGGPDVA